MEELGCLIVDPQEKFLSVCQKPEALIQRLAFTMEVCTLLKIPVWVSLQAPQKMGHLHPSLAPLLQEEHSVFEKETFSALGNQQLVEELNEKDIAHLLIAGIETPICVYQSALDAINADFQVTLLNDALGARRNEDANAALRFLTIHGCHLLPSESVFYAMISNIQHPHFREFTRLVKKWT